MSVILDTSVLIAATTLDPGEDYAVSAASIAELHFGVLKAAGSPAQALRLRRLAEIENAFDVIPMDVTVARAYAECAAAVHATGRNPRARVFDLVIAATARTVGATVLTHNLRDFDGLEGLVTVELAR
ncbi:MAG: PIN domain-containing protein [Rhodoglobus sp.]